MSFFGGFANFSLSSICLSVSAISNFLLGMSIFIMSPSFTAAIGPFSKASGDI